MALRRQEHHIIAWKEGAMIGQAIIDKHLDVDSMMDMRHAPLRCVLGLIQQRGAPKSERAILDQ